jgi:Tfp pilus assembly protein FimT
MLVMMVIAILGGMAIPQVTSGRDRARAVAAARRLAQLCQVARFQAVSRGRYVALHFAAAGGDYTVQPFADGNGNGVQVADIANGVDLAVQPPLQLSGDFAGARIAVDPAVGNGVNPLALGGTQLLSFSPDGTATSGSVYVLGRDGTQMVVRVFGATGRIRVLRFERSTATWERP